VHHAMEFRVVYGFNMQFVTISRRIVEELQNGGPFYRSPFPDYYAMNMLFLHAARIVVEPRPCVVIGVSPKSYGFFHANRREQTGKAMLEGVYADGEQTPAESALLPGSNINDGWLQAMQAVHDATDGDLGMHPNLHRYRMLQLAYVYQRYFLDQEISREQLEQLRDYMRPWERIVYGSAGRLLGALARSSDFLDRVVHDVLRRGLRQLPSWNPPTDPRRFENILDVCEHFDPDSDPAASGSGPAVGR